VAVDDGHTRALSLIVAALCCYRFVWAGEIAMSGRVNWSRISNRDRMRRQGVEDVKGKMPFVGQPPKQPRRKLSKAELREQAADLARTPDSQRQVAQPELSDQQRPQYVDSIPSPSTHPSAITACFERRVAKCYRVKLGEALPWCCVLLLRRIAVRAGRRAWRSFAQSI